MEGQQLGAVGRRSFDRPDAFPARRSAHRELARRNEDQLHAEGIRLDDLLPALTALLAEAHRALRPRGLLLVETVNPQSVRGLLEATPRQREYLLAGSALNYVRRQWKK